MWRAIFLMYAIIGGAQPAVGYETPESYKYKYKDLSTQDLIHNDDGSISFGVSKLFRRGGLRILHLKGDSYEMAFQHGRLLREEIKNGALPQTAMIVRNSVLNSFPVAPGLTDAVINVIYRLYSGSMVSYASKALGVSEDQFLADAYGMADAAGLSVDQVVHALTGPETLQVILGERLTGGSKLPAPLMVNECTDFSAMALNKSGIVIGRNTDYPLNGTFDRFPTVIYYHPTDGDQKFMSITSAGLHTAGVVGLNESGLYLGIHTIPTRDVSKQGIPAFYIGERILRKARNFDAAVKMFASLRPAAGWSYTLVSLNERRSGTIEFNNKKFALRESNESWHVQTNHYLSEHMKGSNLDLNATINADTRARFNRTRDLLAHHDFSMTAERAVEILSDKIDPFSGQVRGLGNVIAVHTTLTSAVVDSAVRKIYVASGLAPVSTTPFIEVPFVEDFDPNKFSGNDFHVIENSSYHREYAHISEAEQLYIAAKTAYETELNPAKAASILSRVITIDPENPGYKFVLALMYLKSGDFSSAETALKISELSDDQHYRLASQYYLARIAAHRGERLVAEDYLEKVLRHGEPSMEGPLLQAAKASLKKIKRRGALRLNHQTIAVFMPEADVVQY